MIWSEYRFDPIPFKAIVSAGQFTLVQRDLCCVYICADTTAGLMNHGS